MRTREVDRMRADLRDYGHVVNRRKALRELHPPLERVVLDLEARGNPGLSHREAA